MTAPVQLGTDLGERGHGRDGRLLDVFVETARRLEHPGVDIQLLALAGDDLLRRVRHELLVGELALRAPLPARRVRSPASGALSRRGASPRRAGSPRPRPPRATKPTRAVSRLHGSHPGQRGEDALVDALRHEPFELAVDLRLGPERAHRRDGPPGAVEQAVGLLVFECGVRLRSLASRAGSVLPLRSPSPPSRRA